jgi:hypothetical protein
MLLRRLYLLGISVALSLGLAAGTAVVSTSPVAAEACWRDHSLAGLCSQWCSVSDPECPCRCAEEID